MPKARAHSRAQREVRKLKTRQACRRQLAPRPPAAPRGGPSGALLPARPLLEPRLGNSSPRSADDRFMPRAVAGRLLLKQQAAASVAGGGCRGGAPGAARVARRWAISRWRWAAGRVGLRPRPAGAALGQRSSCRKFVWREKGPGTGAGQQRCVTAQGNGTQQSPRECRPELAPRQAGVRCAEAQTRLQDLHSTIHTPLPLTHAPPRSIAAPIAARPAYRSPHAPRSPPLPLGPPSSTSAAKCRPKSSVL